MTKYLAYAGIGSRETPEHILTIMHHIGAYLCSEGWTLRSGAAQGADSAFEKGADDELARVIQQMKMLGADGPTVKEIYLPWKGFNNSISRLHPELIPYTQQEIDFTASYHPAWDKCKPWAKRLHTRNKRQLLGTEHVNGPEVILSKFVVCWTRNGALVGGTAQALRIANALHIPICNLGSAKNEKELEQQLLSLDELQKKLKEVSSEPTQTT